MSKKPLILCSVAMTLLLCFLLGLAIGLSQTDRVSEYNLSLLQHEYDSVEKNKPAPNMHDLLAVWKTIASVQHEIDSKIRKKGIIYQLQEGLLVKKYRYPRLSPVVRGALQARNMSLEQYFSLEAALVERCKGLQSQTEASKILFGTEMKLSLINSYINVPIKKEVLIDDNDQTWANIQSDIFGFTATNYSGIDELDLMMLYDVIKSKMK